jgi:methoxymalonate biosynthesis acyl carrier protein
VKIYNQEAAPLVPDTFAVRSAAREVASQIAGRAVRDDQRLVSSGLIDSLSILKLISQLERKLKVSIPTDALQPEDFDNVDLMVETVQRVAKPVG